MLVNACVHRGALNCCVSWVHSNCRPDVAGRHTGDFWQGSLPFHALLRPAYSPLCSRPPTAAPVTGTLILQGGFHTTALVRTGACLTSFAGRPSVPLLGLNTNSPQVSRISGMVPLWEMLYVYLGDESLTIGRRILEDGLVSGLHPDAKRWKATLHHTLPRLARCFTSASSSREEKGWARD